MLFRSGPNPRPKILIPFRARGRVEIVIEVVHVVPGFLETLKVTLNGAAADFEVGPGADFANEIRIRGRLLEDRASYVSLEGSMAIAGELGGSKESRRIGVAAGDLIARSRE